MMYSPYHDATMAHWIALSDENRIVLLLTRQRSCSDKILQAKTASYASETYRRLKIRDLEGVVEYCSEKIRLIKFGRKNPQKQNVREHRYKMSRGETAKIIATQKGLCAICKSVLNKGFHLDHCHTWGFIRGALCRGCNIGLGNFKDDESLLLSAVEYLKSRRPRVAS